MRKITCHCEQVFTADLPESVNLDSEPAAIEAIANGSFLTCVCPTCNAVLHTDLKTRIEWPSRKTTLTLISEIDRLSYLSGNMPKEKDSSVVIGYAELADRVAVLAAGLNPLAIESLKYHLAEKALESSNGAKISILFEKLNASGDIVFHIHGLKNDEVAVTTIPSQIYDSILGDIKKNGETEAYTALQNGTYLSFQNILIEDGMHG